MKPRHDEPSIVYPPRGAEASVRASAAFAMLLVAGHPASAVCRLEGMSASLDQANVFLKDPNILFHRGANGLPRVSFAVMQFATNAPASRLVVLKPIFAKANAEQQEAIGKGLYQAFYTCQQTNYADAAAIQGMLVTMGDVRMLAAFQRARLRLEAPDDKTAASDDGGDRRASDARLDKLLPGLRDTGSLDLADPTTLPGD